MKVCESSSLLDNVLVMSKVKFSMTRPTYTSNCRGASISLTSISLIGVPFPLMVTLLVISRKLRLFGCISRIRGSNRPFSFYCSPI